MNRLLASVEFCAADKEVVLIAANGSLQTMDKFAGAIEALSEEIAVCFPEAYQALANLYSESKLNRAYYLQRIVSRFLKCNYSPCDNKPDFHGGTFANLEYVPCPLRGECTLEGVVCHPKFKPTLRPSEIRVMTKWYEGLNEDEISQALCVSPFTVHNHIRNAYARLGVHSRSEFIKYAAQHNLFP